MANIIQQDVKKTSKVFLPPMSCSLILVTFRARKIYMERFLGTPNTLTHSKIFKTLVCETLPFKSLLFIFRPRFKIFVLFRMRK